MQLVVVVAAGCTGVGLGLAADRRLWRRHDVRNGAIEDGDRRGDARTAGASRRRRRLLGPLVRLGRLELLVFVAAGCIGLVLACNSALEDDHERGGTRATGPSSWRRR